MFTPQQRKTLLQIARAALEAAVHSRPYHPEVDDPGLTGPGAAFVTLKRRGELRGCIGTVEPREPLYLNVARMARAAALEDYRFPPVSPAEVGRLTIDISVLTPARPVANVEEIEVGMHGLIVEQGAHRGLLLPQVPAEWGWNREEFLVHTCRKAGLPDDAWRTGAKLFAFSAEVFGEGE